MPSSSSSSLADILDLRLLGVTAGVVRPRLLPEDGVPPPPEASASLRSFAKRSEMALAVGLAGASLA